MVWRFLLILIGLAAAGCGDPVRRFAAAGETPSDADLRLVGRSIADEIADRGIVAAGARVAQGRVVVRADGAVVRGSALLDAASLRLQDAHRIALGGAGDWRLDAEVAVSDGPVVEGSQERRDWRISARLSREGGTVLLDERVVTMHHPVRPRWK